MQLLTVGDSHKNYLEGLASSTAGFVDVWADLSVYGIQPTAKNLTQDNSTSKGRKLLFTAVERVKNEGGMLVLFYGEIDARIHIPKRWLVDGVPVERGVEDTVAEYGKALLEIKEMGLADQIIVHGIVPLTSVGHYTNFPELPLESHVRVYQMLNQKLKLFCGRNGFKFFDIMPLVSTPEGLLQEKWDSDGTHLKKDASELFLNYLSSHVRL